MLQNVEYNLSGTAQRNFQYKSQKEFSGGVSGGVPGGLAGGPTAGGVLLEQVFPSMRSLLHGITSR